MCPHSNHDQKNRPMDLGGWLFFSGFVGLAISVAVEQLTNIPEIGKIGKVVFGILLVAMAVIAWVTGESTVNISEQTEEAEDEKTN